MKNSSGLSSKYFRNLGIMAAGAAGSFILLRQLKRMGWSNLLTRSSVLMLSAFLSKKLSNGMTDSTLESDWQSERTASEKADDVNPMWHH
jgi:hypothetical protein